MSTMTDDNRALTYAEMREQNLFTDAVVKSSSGREWNIHKVVMSVQGRFFSNAFSFPSFSGTLDLGVSDDVVETMIDFVYRGVCRVNIENALEVLSAAFMYQSEALIEICVTFVMNNMISLEHALALKVFVRDHQVEMDTCMDGALIHIVDRFIRRNFIDLYLKDDVYQLAVLDIVDFIKEDDLNVGEEELLYFVLNYIEFHQLNKEAVKQLLAHVRLKGIDPPKLAQILYEKEILQNEMEAKWDENGHPRHPRDIVLVIDSGWDTEIFNIRKNEWKQLDMTGISPDIILGNMLYEIEFLDNGLTKIKCLDIKKGHFMTEKHSQLPYDDEMDDISLLRWNGGILAFMCNEFFYGAAFYYPQENSWVTFPGRRYAVHVDVNGILFAIGGRNQEEEEDSEDDVLRKNIEYFDTVTMSWALCGSLKETPECLKVRVVEAKVYVFSLDADVSSFNQRYAECFQPVWENGRMRLNWFPNIQLPRGNVNAGISVLDNKILFTGGIHYGVEDLGRKQCHIFSPRTGEWSLVADLHRNKIGHRAITINTSEFEVGRIQQICDGQLVVSDDAQ